MAGERKSIGAAYGLLLAFGYVGAHRFYLLRPVSGTLQAGLTLAGFALGFTLLQDVYQGALSMLSGDFTPESGLLEGNLTPSQRAAAWGAGGCLGAMLVWLAGDLLTMPFWEKKSG